GQVPSAEFFETNDEETSSQTLSLIVDSPGNGFVWLPWPSLSQPHFVQEIVSRCLRYLDILVFYTWQVPLTVMPETDAHSHSPQHLGRSFLRGLIS
ncbi:hypothetical protein NPIL_61641, partial [Nephila pilipes]